MQQRSLTTTSLPPGGRVLGFEVVTGSPGGGRRLEEGKGSKKLTFLVDIQLVIFAVAGAWNFQVHQAWFRV
jgi:hypothetical protein